MPIPHCYPVQYVLFLSIYYYCSAITGVFIPATVTSVATTERASQWIIKQTKGQENIIK